MKLFHRISIICGALLLLGLLWRTGPISIFNELARMGWGLVPIVLMEGVGDIFRTIGWRCCFSDNYRNISFGKLYFIGLSGYTINCLTPTATIGGEITKAALLSEYGRGSQAASSVMIGKLALASAQLLFATAGSLITFWGMDLPSGLLTGLVMGSGLLGLSLTVFFYVQKRGKIGALIRWLTARNMGGIWLKSVSGKLENVDSELKSFYNVRPWFLPLAIFWYILGFACGIVQIWLFLILVGADVSLNRAAGAWFMANWFDLLVFMVPLDIGVQEGSRVIAMRAVGYTSVLGMAYAITLRLQQVFWVSLGLLGYAVLTSKSKKNRNFSNSLLDKSS
jgi:glycosyltransferase 2 family protein